MNLMNLMCFFKLTIGLKFYDWKTKLVLKTYKNLSWNSKWAFSTNFCLDTEYLNKKIIPFYFQKSLIEKKNMKPRTHKIIRTPCFFPKKSYLSRIFVIIE